MARIRILGSHLRIAPTTTSMYLLFFPSNIPEVQSLMKALKSDLWEGSFSKGELLSKFLVIPTIYLANSYYIMKSICIKVCM